MDAQAFRDFVLKVLIDAFPEEVFQSGSRDEVIRWRDTEIGLHNLHAEAALARTDLDKVRSTIVEHFSRIVKLTDSELSQLPPTWEEAKSRVRLQLMPASFARAGINVTFPFSEEVLVSVVVDAEHGYAYIRTEDLERWEIGLVDLYETARDNLQNASQNLGVSYFPGPPPIIALDIADGYAAARILLPTLREFAIEKLGTPFHAGIPNRDFLILWPANTPDDFQKRIREQLHEDAESRSHPLSSRVLTVTQDTIK